MATVYGVCAEKPKVYCSDCKWQRDGCSSLVPSIVPYLKICAHPARRKVENKYSHPRVTYRSECKDVNKNGECKDYERKWWKFWA